jgi:glyoxylase-like metal-dependent hydrolase (beta-lactamase superfamily II)
VLARLGERAGLRAANITHVLCTSWSPDHRRGLSAFDDAQWLLYEPERESALAAIESRLADAEADGEDDLVRALELEENLARRTVIAPQQIAPGVDLFPLPGPTLGTCGLILSLPAATVLLCGDAVATVEHLEQGKVLPGCADIDQSQESFREAVEIADAMILGRDNIVFNPLRRRM